MDAHFFLRMIYQTVGDTILLVVLFILSGFFSGSETALTSLSMARVKVFLKEKRRGARSLYILKKNTNRMLISILIGNNIVNIGASAMATVIATELFGKFGPGLAVGVLTILILIFGEITPKTFAARYSGPIALFVAPLLLAFTWLVIPLVWVMEKLTIYLQGLSSADTEPTVTESELLYMAEHGAKEGTIEPDEQEMIERIFAFEHLRAGDIMIPRLQVFTLDGKRSIADALPNILAQPHTRIPLYIDEPDEIRQVVYLRDILKEVAAQNTDKLLSEIQSYPALFVPFNQPIDKLFPTLRGMEERLVVVVDEYGALEGIFTLEDMLEELVGEIYDEADKQQKQIQQLNSKELLSEGTIEIRIIEDFLDVKLSGRPTDSVNLWILNYINRIPTKGERFTIDNLEVVVEKASQRRIHQVRVIQP